MFAPASRRARRRLQLLIVLALASSSFSLTAPAANAVEPLPGQIECGGTGTAGELPSGPWTLSGVVTDAESSQGVGGVRVEVMQLLDGRPFGKGSTTTEFDGYWSLSGVGDAIYIVKFSDDTETYRNGWWTTDGLVIGSENAEGISIAGADAVHVDMALPYEAPLILSGHVSAPDGAPVEDILVTATDADFGISGCSRTDASGDWAMRIRTGRYFIKVTDDSGRFLAAFFDASNPPTHIALSQPVASRLDLTEDRADIDMQYPEVHPVEGTVNTVDGSLPGVFVSVCGPLPSTSCIASDDTDESGAYRVDVPNGEYIARLEDPTGTYRSGYWRGNTPRFDLEDAEAFLVDGGASISFSTYLNARASGTITDADGTPLEGLSLELCDPDQTFCSYATTDVAGSYTTGGLPPNDYSLKVTDPTGDHPSGYLAAGGAFSQLPSDAAPMSVGDPDVTDLNVRIPDGYRIGGTLLVDGVPGDGWSIGVCPIADWCVAEVSTDIDGAFLTPAVLPGTYRLQTFTDDRVFYLEGLEAIPSFNDATAVPVVEAAVGGIIFQVHQPPAGAETPVGTNVEVVPEDPNTGQAPVSLTFDNVTSEGVTSLSISNDGPPTPSGFQLGDPPTWFDISTTATFAGSVEVCIYYGGVEFVDESNLALLHYSESADPPAWEDVTTSHDIDADMICGLTDSFSPFAVVARSPIFGGFESPVDARPIVNKAKAGSSIPVTFGLGGDFGMDILGEGSPWSIQTDCQENEVDAIESTAGAGSSGLRYDAATGLYTYVWKTSKAWAGTCRTLILELADGSRERADFLFKK